MNDITVTNKSLALSEPEMLKVLKSSLYPGASDDSIKMVLSYCRAAGYDPMQKSVHIVPMWDGKAKQMRDVIMPGVGLYRTQAARTGQLAGVSEPEFGEDVTETLGGQVVTYPKWCRVSVKRRLATGEIVEFVAKEFWKENYAVRGGQEKSIAPNAMWARRTYGQLAKCAQAQAFRIGFPEAVGANATAEELEGKELTQEHDITPIPEIMKSTPRAVIDAMSDEEREFLVNIANEIKIPLAEGESVAACELYAYHKAKLDADEQVALWALFDALQRREIKKAGEFLNQQNGKQE